MSETADLLMRGRGLLKGIEVRSIDYRIIIEKTV